MGRIFGMQHVKWRGFAALLASIGPVFLTVVGLLTVIGCASVHRPYQPSAAYQQGAIEYLAQNRPSMPQNWQWSMHTLPDNTQLRWGYASPEGPIKGTVIYVPGFASTLEVHGSFLSEIQAAGYAIMGVDLRGHGGSTRMVKANREKIWIDDFSHYGKDLDHWLTARRFADAPVTLVGSSMGGHVAVRLAAEFNPDIDRLVLLAPAFEIKLSPLLGMLARGMVSMGHRLGFSQSYAVGQTDWRPRSMDFTQGTPCSTAVNRAHVKNVLYFSNLDMRVGGATNEFLHQFFLSNDKIQQADYLAKLNLPVFVITAEEDSIVESAAARDACRLHIPHCQHLEIKKARHCLTEERPEVMQKIIDTITTTTWQ